jgi:hypothetical protein
VESPYLKDSSQGFAHIRTYSEFKSERLSTNINLTLQKALIRSVMIYACPAWESAAGAQLLKLQSLKNRLLRTTGNPGSCKPIRELHVTFNFFLRV